MQQAERDVHLDLITRFDQRERPADEAFRGNVQDTGAVAGARHTRVGDAQHIPHACLHELARDRQHPPLRHARTTLGPGVLQHQHVIGRDIQILALDFGRHVIVVAEHQRGATVLPQARLRCRWLHHRAARRQIASQHGRRALGVDGFVEGQNDLIVVDRRVGDRLTQRHARDRHGAAVEPVAQRLHQCRQAAGVVEVLHQERAGWADVGDDRHFARELIEALERQRDPCAPRHGDDVDDGVGRAAERHVHLDGVVERGGREHRSGRQILPDHVHDPPTGGGCHTRMSGIGGGQCGRAGQRHPHRLGDRHHGRCGAHGHAGAERAGDTVLDFSPLRLRDPAGALFVPVFPGIGAGAERLAPPVTAQHRAGGNEDRRQAHGDGAHDEPRRGFIATAEQNCAVDRVRA